MPHAKAVREPFVLLFTLCTLVPTLHPLRLARITLGGAGALRSSKLLPSAPQGLSVKLHECVWYSNHLDSNLRIIAVWVF